MAQARPDRVMHLAPARVDVIAPAELGATAVAALRARGIQGRVVERADDTDGVIAWALPAPPSAATAVEIAERCARASEAGRPVVLLAPAVRGSNRAAIERVAALSHIRAYGGAILHDVDAWLEAVVLLVRFGLPAGPRTAVIAPEGSWLHAQAQAIIVEAEALGSRSPLTAPDDPTDVALYDPTLGDPPRNVPALHVAVAPRGELAGDEPALYSVRAALGAVVALGRAAERIGIGLGPAPRTASAELQVDRAKVAGQIDTIVGLGASHITDHHVKGLLRSYNVEITRQAVGLTPSGAVKKARAIGFPVELKPFGHELTEAEGCPVERNVTSDALVRQAFTAVLARAKLPEDSAVIVRAAPIPGREVSVTFLELPALGWTVVLNAPGAQLAAAPAPLRLIDAETLAAHVITSRADDPDPDRRGLANILRRTSHLVVDVDQIARLELPRVIVGGRGATTIVVDAAATLR